MDGFFRPGATIFIPVGALVRKLPFGQAARPLVTEAMVRLTTLGGWSGSVDGVTVSGVTTQVLAATLVLPAIQDWDGPYELDTGTGIEIPAGTEFGSFVSQVTVPDGSGTTPDPAPPIEPPAPSEPPEPGEPPSPPGTGTGQGSSRTRTTLLVLAIVVASGAVIVGGVALWRRRQVDYLLQEGAGRR